MKLSLVVPCYNEQDNVTDFCKECVRVFSKGDFKYEFVFVDDGSTDETLKRLKEINSLNKLNVTIVSFSRNFGKEAAIYAGLKRAEGDLICVIDADLQQRPEVVISMMSYLQEHPDYDCVAAYQKDRNESKILKWFKKNFYKTINMLCTTKLYPGASDFRLMKRQMVDAVLEMSEYHRFSKGIFSWVGFKTHYMPYQARERNAGQTKWSFTKLFNYAIEGIVAFTTKPLRIPIYLGGLSLLGSLVYFIYMIVKLVLKTYTTAHLAVYFILLMGGLLLISMGIIGEYLSKTYIQVKNRPVYIEKEVITSKGIGNIWKN